MSVLCKSVWQRDIRDPTPARMKDIIPKNQSARTRLRRDEYRVFIARFNGFRNPALQYLVPPRVVHNIALNQHVLHHRILRQLAGFETNHSAAGRLPIVILVAEPEVGEDVVRDNIATGEVRNTGRPVFMAARLESI